MLSLRNVRVSRDPIFWWAFLICTVATLIPIWSFKYLPMVDLPHHAVQVSILQHFNDRDFGFVGQYKINWFTPYALAYYIAWFFSYFFSILVSMKIVVSLISIALPFSFLYLLNQTGGDPWWSLVGFGGAFGLNFLWGLFNYCFAVPIGIFCIGAAIQYAYVPNRFNSRLLFFLMLLLFFSHGVVFAVAFTINTWIVFSYSSRLHHRYRRYWPVWLPTIVAVIWYLMPAKGVPRIDSYIQWDNYGLKRLLQIPGTIVSVSGDKTAERIGIGLFCAMLFGAKPVWQWKRITVFLGTILLFQYSPFQFLGHAFIYPRVAIFVLAGCFIWFRKTPYVWRSYISRLAIVGILIAWSVITTQRFAGFNQETSDFDEVMKDVLPNKSLMALTFNRDSAYVPAQQFYHFAVWYQAEKGGQIGYSIAYLYNVIARYKAGREPLPYYMSARVWAAPSNMNWKDYGKFDYYVVRTHSDLPKGLFEDSHGAAELQAHVGQWWLFRNKETLQ